VQPGQTVILMQFIAQRAHGDAAGATTQAEALVNLSDAEALVGMTDEEKAAVVNFKVVVPGVSTGVSGQVTNGVTAVPGAHLSLLGESGGLVARTVADASGQFFVSGLAAGGYRLVAWDPVSKLAGWTDVSVAQGAIATDVNVAWTPFSRTGRSRSKGWRWQGEASRSRRSTCPPGPSPSRPTAGQGHR